MVVERVIQQRESPELEEGGLRAVAIGEIKSPTNIEMIGAQ
jgi:hypothetical protein